MRILHSSHSYICSQYARFHASYMHVLPKIMLETTQLNEKLMHEVQRTYGSKQENSLEYLEFVTCCRYGMLVSWCSTYCLFIGSELQKTCPPWLYHNCYWQTKYSVHRLLPGNLIQVWPKVCMAVQYNLHKVYSHSLFVTYSWCLACANVHQVLLLFLWNSHWNLEILGVAGGWS